MLPLQPSQMTLGWSPVGSADAVDGVKRDPIRVDLRAMPRGRGRSVDSEVRLVGGGEGRVAGTEGCSLATSTLTSA